MKTRIISGVVGVIILIMVLAVFNTPLFNLAVALIAMLAVYEVISALGKEHKTGLLAISFLFVAFVSCYDLLPGLGLSHMALAAFVYVFAMLCNTVFLHGVVSFADTCVVIVETLVILTCFGLLIFLRSFAGPHAIYYIVVALLCAWGADTGAYFAGRFFGKHKLAPKVSPKKTIEGSVGGAIVCMVLVIAVTAVYGYIATCNVNYVALCVISLLSALIGMLGDLIASSLKREHDVKDYGWIMPGHGGIMDRFDSVLFTVPAVVLMTVHFPIVF